MTKWDASQFWTWVDTEREARALSWSKMERDAGLSNAAISRRFRDLLKPTLETCRAIAMAFNIREIDVLMQAGLTDSEIDQDDLPLAVRSTIRMMLDMNAKEQGDVAAFVKTFHERRSGTASSRKARGAQKT
jgi:transcriptional regulator with XRE-family HTH domain